MSQHVDDLMHTAADKAASVHWRSMGAPSQQNAKAMYVTRFREWLGIECVRSHAKLKADRLTEALAAAKNPPGGVKQAAERQETVRTTPSIAVLAPVWAGRGSWTRRQVATAAERRRVRACWCLGHRVIIWAARG